MVARIYCPALQAKAGPLHPMTVLFVLSSAIGLVPLEAAAQVTFGARAAWHFRITGGLASF